MRVNLLLVAAAFIVAFPCANAQVTIYGTFSSVHLSGVDTGVSLTSSGFQTNTDSFFASGIGGGVTLNFLHLGPAALGFDLRGSTRPGTPGADTAMAGIKLGLHPPRTRIKPYVQFSGGYLASRTPFRGSDPPGPNATVSNKYAAYEVLGGVDYSVAHFIDVRVVEIGVGKAFDVGIGSSDNPTLFTINTGIVVHF